MAGLTGQPTSNQGRAKPPLQLSVFLSWVYGLLGIVAAALLGPASGVQEDGRRQPSPTYPRFNLGFELPTSLQDFHLGGGAGGGEAGSHAEFLLLPLEIAPIARVDKGLKLGKPK